MTADDTTTRKLTDEEDEDLRKAAFDISNAIEEGILATQTTLRIPLTSITIGYNRYRTQSSDHSTRVIEIRIWWRE